MQATAPRSESTTSALPAAAAGWQAILDALPVAGYTCDLTGHITFFNDRAQVVWGRVPRIRDRRDLYCGSHRMFTKEGAPLTHEQCWMALALREDQSFNGRALSIERPDGSCSSCLAYANPLHDSAGQLIGAVNLIASPTPVPDRTLAIIGVTLGVLAGLPWPTSAFA